MELTGHLIKMHTQYDEQQAKIDYFLPLADENIYMNELIGKRIFLEYKNEIRCIGCGKKTPKSYHQGYCYQCFLTSPQTDPAIIHPELDMAHEGISRDMEWARKYSLVPHIVYLAVSSGLKVGVTREENKFTRWIDQGASSAIILAQTPYRHLAGLIEVELKNHYDDKTNWRHMLTGKVNMQTDLLKIKEEAKNHLPSELAAYYFSDNKIFHFHYPVISYPNKIKSINLEKEKYIEGRLHGIKGQYLIFDDGQVINIRKYNGYLVRFGVI